MFVLRSTSKLRSSSVLHQLSPSWAVRFLRHMIFWSVCTSPSLVEFHIKFTPHNANRLQSLWFIFLLQATLQVRSTVWEQVAISLSSPELSLLRQPWVWFSLAVAPFHSTYASSWRFRLEIQVDPTTPAFCYSLDPSLVSVSPVLQWASTFPIRGPPSVSWSYFSQLPRASSPLESPLFT